MDVLDQRADAVTPAVRLRRFVGGAGTSWLVLQVAASLLGGLEAVAAFGSLVGLEMIVLAPVAGLLVIAVGRFRGAGLAICALAGAAGGIGLMLVFGVFDPLYSGIPACVGAGSGIAGWFASRRAGRSVSWTVIPPLAAGGLFSAAIASMG